MLAASLAILLTAGCKNGKQDAQAKTDSTATATADTANKPAGDTTLQPSADTTAAARVVDPKAEAELKNFLFSTPATYGWETKANKISLDFFQDGRLHIQGPDGEATMWSGKWKLSGDKLTMNRPDLGKEITVTARRDGKFLMLDSTRYTRYVPYRKGI